MRKIYTFLIQLLLLITIISPFFHKNTTLAAETPSTCSIIGVYDSDNPDQALADNKDYRKIDLKIQTDGGLLDESGYWIRIVGPGLPEGGNSFIRKGSEGNPYAFKIGDKFRVSKDREVELMTADTITIPELSTNLEMNRGADIWIASSEPYTVYIFTAGVARDEGIRCWVTFEIKGPTGGASNYCEIQLTTPKDEFNHQGYLGFKVTFTPPGDYSTIKIDPPENDTYMHRVYIKNQFKQIVNPDNLSKYSTSALINGVTLNKHLSDNDYEMVVRQRAEDLIFGNEGKSCSVRFSLGKNGGLGCVGGLAGDRQCQSLEGYDGYLCLLATDSARLVCRLPDSGEGHNPCTPDSEGNAPFKCQTAIGEISTSPGGFIKSVLVLILSLSGGIIILLIIINGYKLMVSQGDPEKVKEARESVMSAIAGLLLIIFSIVILQFITVDVLHLPGFE